jgi:hypothetical protein
MASTVTWGNLLALLLPGIVFILGVSGMQPQLRDLAEHPDKLSAALVTVLLMCAALVGGIADAARRITTEILLTPLRGNPYEYITPDNLKVWEAGVENSYRYYTFYANLAVVGFAVVLTRLIGRFVGALPAVGPTELFLLLGSGALEYAGRVQYQCFSGFVDGFVAGEKHRRSAENKNA